MNTTKRLYRVTLTDGTVHDVIATKPYIAAQSITRNHCSDIRAMELVTVIPEHFDGKQARTIARQLTGVQTRHVNAFAAKTLVTVGQHGGKARITDVRKDSVTFHLMGAY